MPQLNPSPWLMILVLTWLVFLTILPPKIIAHSFPNEATSQAAHKPKTDPWIWLWP